MKNVFRLVKSKNSKIFSTLLNLFYVYNRKNFFRSLKFSHIKQILKIAKIAFKMNNVSLQTIVSLEKNFSNFSYVSFLSVNFENLIFEFNVPYVLNGTVNEPSFVE